MRTFFFGHISLIIHAYAYIIFIHSCINESPSLNTYVDQKIDRWFLYSFPSGNCSITFVLKLVPVLVGTHVILDKSRLQKSLVKSAKVMLDRLLMC